MDSIDIALVSHNDLETTKRCVDALYRNTNIPFRLFVFDDYTEDVQDYFVTLQNTVYLRPEEPFKCANEIVNLACSLVGSNPFVFMGASTFVEPGWLDSAISIMEQNKRVGVVGFKMCHPETKEVIPYTVTLAGGARTGGDVISKALVVPWCAVLLRKEALTPPLNEEYYMGFSGLDDSDNCIEIYLMGWEIIYNGLGTILHLPSSSNNPNKMVNKQRWIEKWRHKAVEFAGEAYYMR